MCSKNIYRDEYLLVAVILLVYHEIKYMRLIQGSVLKILIDKIFTVELFPSGYGFG